MNSAPIIQPDPESSSSESNTPISLPPSEPTIIGGPVNNPQSFDRTLWYTIGGILLVSCCGILLVAYLFTKTVLFKEVTTFEPLPTIEVTPLPTPNMSATQAAWVKPAKSPVLGSAEEAQIYIDGDSTFYLPNFRLYASPHPDINQPGDIYYYDIYLPTSTQVIWSYGWCTLTAEILEENFAQMKVEFLLNGELVAKEHITRYDHQPEEDRFCRTFAIIVTEWPAGIHKLDSNVTFLEPTDDGWNLYPAGMHTFRYFVSVEP
jgi:hypothetical protein